MGGAFNSAVFHGDMAEVRKQFDAWVSEAEYENGHAGNYTGSIAEKGRGGLTFPHFAKPFKNANLAGQWLEDNNGKWDDAQAVPFVTGEKSRRVESIYCK